MRRLVSMAVLPLFLIAPVAAAKKKKARVVRVAPASTQDSIEAVLDGRGEAISDCVMKNAVNKGATMVDVSVHILINNHGQLFECDMTVKLDKGDSVAVSKCAEQALRAVAYPKSMSPLIVVDRAWHFSTQ